MAMIDFFTGTTTQIEITITVKSEPVDITLDRVTLIIKVAKSDPDSASLLDVDADVGSFGASGRALFPLTPEQTDITPGQYFYDIIWYEVDAEEVVLESGIITIHARVSDYLGEFYMHNDLYGKQGGAEPDEYYHLDFGDYTNVINSVWVLKTGDIMSGDLDMDGNCFVNVGYIDFDLTNMIEAAEGRFTWNDEDGTMNLGLKGGEVNLQLGMEQVFRGKNLTGSDDTDGRPVRISGASGANPELSFSESDVLEAAESIGLYTENVNQNTNGYITTFGLVRGIDTSGTPVGETWADSERIFVGSSPGTLTNVLPSGTDRKIFIGIVTRAHATEGVMWISPINIFFLRELSGMSILNPVDGDHLAYDSVTGTWTNSDSLDIAGGMIGTSPTDLVGYWGATPITRPTGVPVTAAGIHAALVSVGLIAA